jgi:hypothetical protein
LKGEFAEVDVEKTLEDSDDEWRASCQMSILTAVVQNTELYHLQHH